jgi:hypothetical protein
VRRLAKQVERLPGVGHPPEEPPSDPVPPGP